MGLGTASRPAAAPTSATTSLRTAAPPATLTPSSSGRESASALGNVSRTASSAGGQISQPEGFASSLISEGRRVQQLSPQTEAEGSSVAGRFKTALTQVRNLNTKGATAANAFGGAASLIGLVSNAEQLSRNPNDPNKGLTVASMAQQGLNVVKEAGQGFGRFMSNPVVGAIAAKADPAVKGMGAAIDVAGAIKDGSQGDGTGAMFHSGSALGNTAMAIGSALPLIDAVAGTALASTAAGSFLGPVGAVVGLGFGVAVAIHEHNKQKDAASAAEPARGA